MIVSGGPAAGKTTLARRLAEVLRLPLLAKDEFREILADALDARTPAESRALAVPTFRVYLAVLTRLLEAGVGVVAEGNFFRGLAEADFAPLLAHARAVIIHCRVPHDLSVRRFVERHESGDRHPCFFDGERIPALLTGERPDAWTRAEPIELGVPTLLVDTTDGYRPTFEDLLEFVRTAGRTNETALEENGPLTP